MFYENKKEFFLFYCEKNPLQYPLHVHQYIEFVHVVEGSVEMQIGTKKYLVQPGEIVLVFPNVAHDYHTLSAPGETQLHILNCYLDFLPLHKSQLLAMTPRHPVLHTDEIHADISYAEARLFELNQEDYDRTLVSSLVSLMLSRIFPKLDLIPYEDQTQQDLSCEIVAYIGKHFREDISLTSVAKHFGLGKYALSRIFSNVLNLSFVSYLNSLRIDYAEYLLLSTDLGIIDIAIECGYHNQQTFYRLFKSMHDCTPKEYRAQRYTNNFITPPPQDFVYEPEYGLADAEDGHSLS